MRCAMAHAEASGAHQCKMEHLSKRSQVQCIELGKAHVLLERLNLEVQRSEITRVAPPRLC